MEIYDGMLQIRLSLNQLTRFLSPPNGLLITATNLRPLSS